MRSEAFFAGCRFTGATFLVGAVAICGLPPLNGFVSEWLIYLGSFRSLTTAGDWCDVRRIARRARPRVHRRAGRRLLRQSLCVRVPRQPAQPDIAMACPGMRASR